MPNHKPRFPKIVDPCGVNPGLKARPMPVTTDRSRAYTVQATSGEPLVDLAGKSNPYVDYQSVDLLLSLQHPRSEGYDEMCFFVMGQVKELPFKALHFELYNAQQQIRADAQKCSRVGETPGSVLSRHNPHKETPGRPKLPCPPRGAEPAPSERLRAHEWLAKAIGPASPMADDVFRRPGGA
jgi:hypothetical protein